MDYKYIEQLLERYWQCETTLEEEEILHTFFNQKDVPAEFAKYAGLFAYKHVAAQDDILGDDFDERIVAMIDEASPVKARTISLSDCLKPLCKAAAIVAIVVTIGNAAQLSFNDDRDAGETNVAEGYRKSYTTDESSVAYEIPQTLADTLLNGAVVAGEPVN